MNKDELRELIRLVDPTLDRTVQIDRGDVPAVVMVVGVNGTVKTTTVGKLANLVKNGYAPKIVLVESEATELVRLVRAYAFEEATRHGERRPPPAG